MPNQPKTTSRNIRIEDELWEPVKAKAARENPPATASEVVRRGLKEYLEQDEA